MVGDQDFLQCITMFSEELALSIAKQFFQWTELFFFQLQLMAPIKFIHLANAFGQKRHHHEFQFIAWSIYF